MRRDLDKVVQQRGRLRARLENRAFVERADPQVVSDARAQERERGVHQAKLEQILQELGG